jgi:tetratricopeptide (TPR) repeat protein
MTQDASNLPSPSPEHRRVAAGQFERANQVVAARDYDYGIRLYLSCCKLDPANLIYRQALRRTQKLKYRNNLRGAWLAWLTTARARAKIRRALSTKNYPAILEVAEQVLTRNPWDVATQMHMAVAAEALGLLDMAEWSLEQARQKSPELSSLNRALALLYERRGKFAQAIKLWELVHKTDPSDVQARTKVKDLAANETIARGQYESALAASRARATGEDDSEEKPSPRAKNLARKGKEPEAEEETAPEEGDRRIVREVGALRARLEANPTNANTYLQLASVYRKSGKLAEAREVLNSGLGPTGNSFDLTVELADLEIEPFRQNLALTEKRLKDHSDDELRRIRVRLLKEINTRELDLYRMIADRYPSDLGNRFELGVRLLRAGQVDEAIRELQAARNDPKVHWKSLLYLGHSFKGRNNWKLARRNFEEALQHAPANEEAARKELYFQLAQGSADAGDLEDAINFGHELANLDFGYRDIHTLLDQWQARLNQGA